MNKKKILELLAQLQEEFNKKETCAPYTLTHTAPEITITIENKKSGDVIRFYSWQVEIEQWKDSNSNSSLNPIRLKILSDVSSSFHNKVEKV